MQLSKAEVGHGVWGQQCFSILTIEDLMEQNIMKVWVIFPVIIVRDLLLTLA
jgi:hypothetical protein